MLLLRLRRRRMFCWACRYIVDDDSDEEPRRTSKTTLTLSQRTKKILEALLSQDEEDPWRKKIL